MWILWVVTSALAVFYASLIALPIVNNRAVGAMPAWSHIIGCLFVFFFCAGKIGGLPAYLGVTAYAVFVFFPDLLSNPLTVGFSELLIWLDSTWIGLFIRGAALIGIIGYILGGGAVIAFAGVLAPISLAKTVTGRFRKLKTRAVV